MTPENTTTLKLNVFLHEKSLQISGVLVRNTPAHTRWIKAKVKA